MSTPFIGQVSLFAGNFAPRGWQLCAGQIMAIAQNTPLFSILGTTYGGNGTTTFALPDLRGRTAIGNGQGPGLSDYVLGEMAGTENVTLLLSNMPAHNHPLMASLAPEDSQSPTNAALASAGGAAIYTTAGQLDTVMKNGSVGNAGSNIPVSVLSPFLVLNYIIAVQGVFPSRN